MDRKTIPKEDMDKDYKNLYQRSVAPGQPVDMSEESFRDLQIRVISSRRGFLYEYVETWSDELIDHAWSLIMG